jgi:hypothetical protein
MTLFVNKGGRRKLLWSQLLKMSLILIPMGTASTSLAYVVVSGRWDPLAAWLGLAGGVGIVLVILLTHLFTPVNRLPHVR